MGERGWDGAYTFHFFVMTQVSTFKVIFIFKQCRKPGSMLPLQDLLLHVLLRWFKIGALCLSEKIKNTF